MAGRVEHGLGFVLGLNGVCGVPQGGEGEVGGIAGLTHWMEQILSGVRWRDLVCRLSTSRYSPGIERESWF